MSIRDFIKTLCPEPDVLKAIRAGAELEGHS
jgi:hypothetical protein